MLKTIPLHFQNTIVDFLFYQYEGQVDCIGDPKFHKHLNYEIHFALHGTHEYEFSDGALRLDGGQTLIIPPGVLHRITADSEDKYRFTVLTLKLSAEAIDGFCGYFDLIFAGLGSQYLFLITASPSSASLPRCCALCGFRNTPCCRSFATLFR